MKLSLQQFEVDWEDESNSKDPSLHLDKAVKEIYISSNFDNDNFYIVSIISIGLDRFSVNTLCFNTKETNCYKFYITEFKQAFKPYNTLIIRLDNQKDLFKNYCILHLPLYSSTLRAFDEIVSEFYPLNQVNVSVRLNNKTDAPAPEGIATTFFKGETRLVFDYLFNSVEISSDHKKCKKGDKKFEESNVKILFRNDDHYLKTWHDSIPKPENMNVKYFFYQLDNLTKRFTGQTECLSCTSAAMAMSVGSSYNYMTESEFIALLERGGFTDSLPCNELKDFKIKSSSSANRDNELTRYIYNIVNNSQPPYDFIKNLKQDLGIGKSIARSILNFYPEFIEVKDSKYQLFI